MGWADINIYTAAEVLKAKAEVDEVSGLINGLVAKINRVAGKLTDQERELLRVKGWVDARVAGLESAPEDTLAVSGAKTALAGGTFTAAQEDAGTEEAAAAQAAAQVAVLVAGAAATEITKVSYTPAVAGDEVDADGTDGSYVFKVGISSGLIADETGNLTMAITATAYSAG